MPSTSTTYVVTVNMLGIIKQMKSELAKYTGNGMTFPYLVYLKLSKGLAWAAWPHILLHILPHSSLL